MGQINTTGDSQFAAISLFCQFTAQVRGKKNIQGAILSKLLEPEYKAQITPIRRENCLTETTTNQHDHVEPGDFTADADNIETSPLSSGEIGLLSLTLQLHSVYTV